MKITQAEIIKTGEKELLDTIVGDLDWGIIENIFKEKHNLAIKDDVEYYEGDIVVQDGQIAYKLDFEVKMVLSIIFDRDGNHLSLETPKAKDRFPDPPPDTDTSLLETEEIAKPAAETESSLEQDLIQAEATLIAEAENIVEDEY